MAHSTHTHDDALVEDTQGCDICAAADASPQRVAEREESAQQQSEDRQFMAQMYAKYAHLGREAQHRAVMSELLNKPMGVPQDSD